MCLPGDNEKDDEGSGTPILVLYCIVLYLQPVLNPKSYDGARVLEASGRPMLVIGRSYFVSIQVIEEVVEEADDETITGAGETETGDEAMTRGDNRIVGRINRGSSNSNEIGRGNNRIINRGSNNRFNRIRDGRNEIDCITGRQFRRNKSRCARNRIMKLV